MSNNQEVVVLLACMDYRVRPFLEIIESDKLSAKEKAEEIKKLMISTDERSLRHSETYSDMERLLKGIYGKQVIVVANAGANMSGLEQTTREIDKNFTVTEVHLLFHRSGMNNETEGCGGKKTIDTVLLTKTPFGDKFRHFDAQSYLDIIDARHGGIELFSTLQFREQLEKVDDIHESVQMKKASEIFPSAKIISIYTINTDQISMPEGKHVYRIVAKREDTEVDREIATFNLGLKEGDTLLVRNYAVSGQSKTAKIEMEKPAPMPKAKVPRN